MDFKENQHSIAKNDASLGVLHTFQKRPSMEENKMNEMDTIEITVEKKQYAQESVHKGMQGWICCDRCIDRYWLVNFPGCGAEDDIAEISIHENDMKLIPKINAGINEIILALHNDP